MPRSGQQPVDLDREDVEIDIPTTTKLLMELRQPLPVGMSWSTALTALVYFGLAAIFYFLDSKDIKFALVWTGLGVWTLIAGVAGVRSAARDQREKMMIQLLEELVAQNNQQRRDLERLARAAKHAATTL